MPFVLSYRSFLEESFLGESSLNHLDVDVMEMLIVAATVFENGAQWGEFTVSISFRYAIGNSEAQLSEPEGEVVRIFSGKVRNSFPCVYL